MDSDQNNLQWLPYDMGTQPDTPDNNDMFNVVIPDGINDIPTDPDIGAGQMHQMNNPAGGAQNQHFGAQNQHFGAQSQNLGAQGRHFVAQGHNFNIDPSLISGFGNGTLHLDQNLNNGGFSNFPMSPGRLSDNAGMDLHQDHPLGQTYNNFAMHPHGFHSPSNGDVNFGPNPPVVQELDDAADDNNGQDGQQDALQQSQANAGAAVPLSVVSGPQVAINAQQDNTAARSDDAASDDDDEDGSPPVQAGTPPAANTPVQTANAQGTNAQSTGQQQQSGSSGLQGQDQYPNPAHPIWGHFGPLHGMIRRIGGIGSNGHPSGVKVRYNDSVGRNARRSTVNTFGHNNLEVGAYFVSLMHAVVRGAHGDAYKGVYGLTNEAARSVVLNGGDLNNDRGNIFDYAPTRAAKTRNNDLADDLKLEMALTSGMPVRAIRGSKGSAHWSPAHGFRYDGLYKVVRRLLRSNGHGGYYMLYTFARLVNQAPIAANIPSHEEDTLAEAFRAGYQGLDKVRYEAECATFEATNPLPVATAGDLPDDLINAQTVLDPAPIIPADEPAIHPGQDVVHTQDPSANSIVPTATMALDFEVSMEDVEDAAQQTDFHPEPVVQQ